MARTRLDTTKAILLSGGIDSAALAYWQKPAYAIHINYGQKCAKAEYRASEAIAKSIGIKFIPITCDLSELGSGDLSKLKALPIAPVSEWWPFRNQMLITIASMQALSLKVSVLLVGAVKSDAKHVDGTKSFFKSIDALISSQEGGLRIKVPGIALSSAQLIRKSGVKNSILGWAHSCHTGDLPCGTCNGCKKHIHIKSRLGLLK